MIWFGGSEEGAIVDADDKECDDGEGPGDDGVTTVPLTEADAGPAGG